MLTMLFSALFVVAFSILQTSDVLSLSWEPRNSYQWPEAFDQGAQSAFLKMRLNRRGRQLSSEPIIFDDLDLKDLIKFFLYTRSNKNEFQQLYVDDLKALNSSFFNKNRPTKFIIHGYLDDVNSEIIQNTKNIFLENNDFNVIAVDWGLIAMTIFYTLAAEKSQMVGEYLGTFIDFLVKNDINIYDFHLIGHSLGAHVAGFAGANVTSGQIPRISGLDPAKPWFTNNPPDQRLDKTDATFVDCIHTCGGYLGFLDPICHADFYPNGGVDVQPGCDAITLGTCSHSRAHEYFAESIIPSHKFFTYKCDDIPQDGPQNCVSSKDLMGYYASPWLDGIYYLQTRSSSPFSFNVTLKIN